MKKKKRVYYIPSKHDQIIAGQRAWLNYGPVDHPGEGVSNNGPVITSPVIWHNPSLGIFETQNTVYEAIK